MTKPRVLLISLLVLLTLTACDGGASGVERALTPSTPAAALEFRQEAPPTPVAQAVIDAADAEYQLMVNLYARSAPSVVNIEVTAPGEAPRTLGISGGSGFIYDTRGHIITNAHVVSAARSIRVTFDDGHVTEARLVGADNYSDIAVIRVDPGTTAAEAARLLPLSLADSDLVQVGQRAIAIGNPFGLNSSMTSGIVSALGRQLSSAELLDGAEPPGFRNPAIIQVDAQINPGNSGGPLLDSAGDVIGVNTAIRSTSGTFEGVGFAVPSNTVRRVVPELIESGFVDYPWIGVSARSGEDGFSVPGMAELLNLPVKQGVLVSYVTQNSPAAKAGVLGGDRLVLVRGEEVCAGGDIIVSIDGEPVRSIDGLVAHLIENNRPGDVVTLRVVRGNQSFDVDVTLERRPSNSEPQVCGR